MSDQINEINLLKILSTFVIYLVTVPLFITDSSLFKYIFVIQCKLNVVYKEQPSTYLVIVHLPTEQRIQCRLKQHHCHLT